VARGDGEMKSSAGKLVISPPAKWVEFPFRDLWAHGDLLYFLIWRHLKVRYRQTLLGVFWVVLQPVVSMLIFSFIFGSFARLPSEGVPYTLFTYTALLPWQLFAYSLSQSSESLVANEQLVTRVYFPRLLIPLTPVLSYLIDFGISFVLLLGLLFFYGIAPNFKILLLPVFVLLAMGSALGVGLWLTALNVRFRDVRYTLPFLTQVWFYLTPVAYSATLIPEQYRFWYGLNPMVAAVEGFRWVLLNKNAPCREMLLSSIAMTLVLLISGSVFFQKMENKFADIL
jgi:lipopolysaccharide transport system permease protein